MSVRSGKLRRTIAIDALKDELSRSHCPMDIGEQGDFYHLHFRPHAYLDKTLPVPSASFKQFVEEYIAAPLGLKVEWNNTRTTFWLADDENARCSGCGTAEDLDVHINRILCGACRAKYGAAERRNHELDL